MNLKDFIKSQPLRIRIGIKWEGIKMSLLAKLGLCKHEGTIGAVGAKYHKCIWCIKDILNEDYKAEKKALKHL